jgi:TolA-binding protein
MGIFGRCRGVAHRSTHAKWLLLVLFFTGSCSVDSVKNRYLLAEKLWNEGSYAAAVVEFDRVSRRDPDGELGRRALLRSAMTQTLFLKEHAEAIRKLKRIAEREGDSELGWEAQKQIGEILFTRMDRSSEAIAHYQLLLKRRPTATEAPEFLFKLGRAYFNGWSFDSALEAFGRVIAEWPTSPWAEKAAMEIAQVWLTRGEQRPGPRFSTQGKEVYREAIRQFEAFISKYPNSKRIAEARFGIASALEELDQLAQALEVFQGIESVYPVPQTVKIKIYRLKERISRRSK